jgi:hypothetical protein
MSCPPFYDGYQSRCGQWSKGCRRDGSARRQRRLGPSDVKSLSRRTGIWPAQRDRSSSASLEPAAGLWVQASVNGSGHEHLDLQLLQPSFAHQR